jgi:hypothetical protein
MDQPGNHVLLRGNQPAAADRMRELLAGTVQDQFADQRSNAGALEGIRQRMEELEPLADELRSRPGHIEIQETLAKIVDAAQSDVATQLGSLEETVLTLAEALLRPHAPQIPAPREASRDGSRDGSRDASRDASREGSRI